MQAPPSRILRSRWAGLVCCLITHSIMKYRKFKISDEESVQQLIAKLKNLLAEQILYMTVHLLYLEKKP